MHIFFSQLLKSMQKANNKRKLDNRNRHDGGERVMKCPTCDLEMNIDKECGYMKQYRCDICGRVETLWTVCVTA